MTDKELIQAIRAMLQISPTISNDNILSIIVEIMIRSHGGDIEFSGLREAQEVG